MKKRGYLLIEVVMYLAVSVVFLTALTTLFIPYLNEYRQQEVKEEKFNYLLSTHVYIDKRVNESKIKEIKCDEDAIYLYIDNPQNQVDVIKAYKGNLIVEYYKNNEKISYNSLLKEVENFNVIEKENLFYVLIKQNNEDERVFCYEKK